MKADRNGTWTEQVRARMGWMSPSDRKAAGKPDAHVCVNCHWMWVKEIPNHDGGASNSSTYCGHRDAAGERGHTTRDTASCDKWELSFK